MQDEENIAQRFFSGGLSRDALAHFYRFFSTEDDLSLRDLFALARTCKSTQKVFQELIKTFYYIPNQALRIKKAVTGSPCLFQYTLPPIDLIRQVYNPGETMLCFRTHVDALRYIELLYKQNPARITIPPIFEVVCENARELPQKMKFTIADFKKHTLVRIALDSHTLKVTKAKFMKYEKGILSPVKTAGGRSEYVDLEAANHVIPSQSRCTIM